MKLLQRLLSRQATRCGISIASKKKALEQVVNMIASHDNDIDSDELFQALISRERLGSTGLGGGVAIPHCRFAGVTSPICAVLTLQSPIDFESIDGKHVDTLFALIVPEEATDTHLQLLAQVAEILQSPASLSNIRKTTSDEELFSTIQAIFETLSATDTTT